MRIELHAFLYKTMQTIHGRIENDEKIASTTLLAKC